MNAIRIPVLAFFTLCVSSSRADDAPTWEKQVGPFFKTYCVGCHDGGDDSKGGLNLLSHKDLMKGGDSGDVVVPGKSDDSRLVQMLLGKDDPQMPPKNSKQPKPDEIAAVARWVDAGAKGPTNPMPQSIDELNIKHIAPKAPVSAAVPAVAFSPDGKWLAAARHREVLLIDAASGKLVQMLSGAENPINAVAFSPNSTLVAAAEGFPSVAGRVCVWEFTSPGAGAPRSPRVFAGHADSIYALAFSPDGARLVTASYDKLLILWDVAAGKPLHELKHHTAAVFSAAFSPDGKTIASVAADQTVKLWNAETGQRILTLTEPTKGLNAVAFHPKGIEIAAAGIDKMIRVYEWNGTAARLKKSTFAHDAPILALTYSPDGTTLFTASEDRRIKAWDAAGLRERHVYENLPDWPLALSIDRTGEKLAVGFYNGTLSLFETGSPKKQHDVLSSQARPVSFLPRCSRGGRADRSLELQLPTRGEPGPLAPGFVRAPFGLLVAVVFGQQPDPPAEKTNPPAPRLDAVSPRTVVRGSKVKFTLAGQNIADADSLLVSHGLKGTLVPGDGKNANQAFCEIEIPADMAPGSVSLRLHTPLGTAGTRSFYVGPFPETGEKEDNNTRDKATAATLPATLVGTINARGDRDLWAFDTQAGQDLVFVVVGPSLGSSLQARVMLLDETGRTLASETRVPWRGETAFGHHFDKAGRYFLQVEDRDYTGGGNHFYYIHAGAFPYVTDVFPLALHSADQGPRRPDEVHWLAVQGYGLGPEAKIVPSAGAGTRFTALDTPIGKTFNAARYEQSPYGEFAEAEPNDRPQDARLIPVPGAITGRIIATGFRSQVSGVRSTAPARQPTRRPVTAADADVTAFDAKAGERLTIEVLARRLGSALDPVAEIFTADGRPLARNTLRAVAETYTVLRDHDSRSKGIRLHHWDDFQPNDYLMIGGEIVKVQIMPLGPDEDVKFFDRQGPRTGFFGTTPQAHAINTTAYKVEIHPPGMSFPPNGMPVVQLDWANDDAPGLGSDSQILFDAPAHGRYYVRVRDVRNLEGDDFYYRLVIRPRQEDFRVSIDPENPNIPRGGSLPVTVNVDRLDGFDGPIDVRVEGLPPGIIATATRIGPGLFSGVLTLTGSADEPVMGMKVIATARAGDKSIEHSSSPGFGSHQVTTTSPPDLLTRVEPTSAVITPGQELRFTVTIERKNAFKGRVPVDVLNLPHGLRVLDVGLNGVLINEDETSRSFVVACDPWAEPGPVTFYAAAKVEAKNERHAAQPIQLQVIGASTVTGN